MSLLSFFCVMTIISAIIGGALAEVVMLLMNSGRKDGSIKNQAPASEDFVKMMESMGYEVQYRLGFRSYFPQSKQKRLGYLIRSLIM